MKKTRIVGIYKIYFKKQPKLLYIGSTKDFVKRRSEHLRELKKNRHHSSILQNYYNKYNNPVIEILQECSEQVRLEIEQEYINKLNPFFNISVSATAPMEGRKHSVKTLEKFKKRKTKKGLEHHLTGKKLKSEHIDKIVASRHGYKHSSETKKKMRETALKNNSGKHLAFVVKKCKIVDNYGIVHNSITAAAKYYGVSPQAICDLLKGRTKKNKKGLHFEYV
jgi:group I intron endonuclease